MQRVIDLLEENVTSYKIDWSSCTTGDSYRVELEGGEQHISGDFPEDLIEKILEYLNEEDK